MAQFQSWLHIFYQRLFPFTDFYRWLAYGEMSKGYFANREWSFTLASDVYIRFQSYKTADELKSEILRLCPVKIDIGAVYNIAPKDKKTVGPSAFRPRERELVFDIDMTDYDDIRTCCSGAEICLKCWDFMTISIKILHRALTEDFGFKHLLWVYSGRRGVHCWVADERARSMSPEARSAVVAYLEVVKGGYHQRGQGDEDPMDERNFHPSLVRAYAVLKKHFAKTILLNMDVLGSREHWMKLLQLVPDHEMRTRLDKEWTDETPDSDSGTTSEERWNRIVGELRGKKGAAFETADRAIIFRYTYPRLDANVSIGLNHLLKAPFCVHPKTGRVCVPIDPTQCDTFNPLTVPTIQSLLDELNAWSAKNNNPSYIEAENYQKTSLEPYVKYFRQGFLDPMASEVRQRMRERVDMSF
ncbi:uncharacterized protein EV422DRAFT_493426 [Fimicolochytrium jonesii]|uniref:uncharacterized protein n=1 Tax=Fimicolochytrium jonesii TaxID=1396493 RepID=UPI0022FF230D|nr:uncharacterized protein EV422DRAFT_493426 [Fimicolochytrium jonesii]KAI8824532.1 hypothetical protein EV422DRAFT_493426 [Fimicolochytrium jonesii]